MIVLRNIYFFYRREGIFRTSLKLFDFLLRPFGVSISSYFYFKNRSLKTSLYFTDNYKYNFSKIYISRFWKTGKNLSGTGSDINVAKYYSQELREVIKKKKFFSIFDCGCGEFGFMDETIKGLKIGYIGGDLVNSILKLNKINYPNYKFIKFDILKNNLPEVKLLHIRDCLFHFSYNDILKALNNFCNSKIKYILLTSHKSLILKNYDIITGDFRYLDFSKQPFYFKNEILKIKDYIFPHFPKYSYLWSNPQIKFFLKKFRE